MKLAEALCVCPGVTAIVGSGGKTALLRVLGEELAAEHRVLLCTTTKIFPFEGLETLRSEEALMLNQQRLACAGKEIPGTGKLTAPDVPMARLAELADYVLVEADGSAGRPLKAHAPHEPVIPAEAGQIICVVGASGLGRPVREAAHRPERYAKLAHAALDDPVTPERAAAVLLAEDLHDRIFINQADAAPAAALALAGTSSCRPGWPRTHRDPLASASRVLGLKSCTTAAWQ